MIKRDKRGKKKKNRVVCQTFNECKENWFVMKRELDRPLSEFLEV